MTTLCFETAIPIIMFNNFLEYYELKCALSVPGKTNNRINRKDKCKEGITVI